MKRHSFGKSNTEKCNLQKFSRQSKTFSKIGEMLHCLHGRQDLSKKILIEMHFSAILTFIRSSDSFQYILLFCHSSGMICVQRPSKIVQLNRMFSKVTIINQFPHLRSNLVPSSALALH